EGQSADIGAIGAILRTLGTAAADALAVQAGGQAATVPPRTRLVGEPDTSEAWEAGAAVTVAALRICGERAALVLVLAAEVLGRVDAAGPDVVEVDSEACGAEGAIAGAALRPV